MMRRIIFCVVLWSCCQTILSAQTGRDKAPYSVELLMGNQFGIYNKFHIPRYVDHTYSHYILEAGGIIPKSVFSPNAELMIRRGLKPKGIGVAVGIQWNSNRFTFDMPGARPLMYNTTVFANEYEVAQYGIVETFTNFSLGLGSCFKYEDQDMYFSALILLSLRKFQQRASTEYQSFSSLISNPDERIEVYSLALSAPSPSLTPVYRITTSMGFILSPSFRFGIFGSLEAMGKEMVIARFEIFDGYLGFNYALPRYYFNCGVKTEYILGKSEAKRKSE